MLIEDLDLAKPPFWIAVVAAALLLCFAKTPPAKRLLFAIVNLGLVAHLIGLANTSIVLATLLAAAWIAGRLHRTARHWPWLLPAGLITLGLFFAQKLPGAAESMHVAGLAPILSAIGFSYAALRLVELWRAMVDRRHEPPGPIETVNYIIPFHMLAAGPIQSFDDFVSQPGVPDRLTATEAIGGIYRIALGCFKKFVLASTVNAILLDDLSEPGAKWVIQAPAFFIWLYLDFSAYSDIACGAGRLMRIHTPENFNRPYLARNMIDFWERWHISLSLWIRRNIFFPTQLTLVRSLGPKRTLLCASIAFVIAFSLCGVWHQVTLGWFLWGLVNAIGLVIVNIYRTRLQRMLGASGVKNYLANKWIHVAAVAVTLALVSLSQVPVIAQL